MYQLTVFVFYLLFFLDIVFFVFVDYCFFCFFFFFSSRRRHTRCLSDWSSDVCSSDLAVCLGYRRADRCLTRGRADRLRPLPPSSETRQQLCDVRSVLD